MSKFTRRHRAALYTTLIVGSLLVSATIVSAWQAVRATQAETLAGKRLKEETRALQAETKALGEAEEAFRLAKRQERLARRQRDMTLRNLYVAHVRLAHQDRKAGNLPRMMKLLEGHLPRKDVPDLRGWEWYYLSSLARQQANVYNPELGRIHNVQWSPDGRLVAIAGAGVKIYEPISRQVVHSLPQQNWVAWSPDGARLATVTRFKRNKRINIWDTENWDVIRSLPTTGPVSNLAWRGDSRGLAWASGLEFSFWQDGQDAPEPMRRPSSTHFGIQAIAWGPEGRRLVIGGAFTSTHLVWDTLEKKLVWEARNGGRGITHIAMNPQNNRLATGSMAGYIDFWDIATGERIDSFPAHAGRIAEFDWSPDGSRLVSGGEDNLIRIWDSKMGRRLNSFPGHRGMVQSVDWSPTEDRIVSGADDGTVRFWRPDGDQDAVQIPGRWAVGWSPDGSQIATDDPRDGDKVTYSIRDARTGQKLRELETTGGSMHVMAWSPNGAMIAGAGFHGEACVWDASTGRMVHSMPTAHCIKGELHNEARCVAWSPDSRQFATCGMDRQIKIWESSSGELLHTFREEASLGSVRWSPDGRWFSSSDWRWHVKIRSADTWEVQWELDRDPSSVGAAAGGDYMIVWSPDSYRLTAVSGLGKLVVWDLSDDEPRKIWAAAPHTSNIRSVAWSPDGARLATGSEDRTVKIFDAADGRELLTLEAHQSLVKAVSWGPDGRRLATVGDDTSIRIWDATEAYEKFSGPDTVAGLSTLQDNDTPPNTIAPTSDHE